MQVTAGVCLFYSLNISFGRLGPITSAPNDQPRRFALTSRAELSDALRATISRFTMENVKT